VEEKNVDEKSRFPMTFDKCPSCGSTKRVAGMIGDEEKAKGRIRKEGLAVAFIQQVVINDPTITVLSAPALMTYYDICADCGDVYCVMAQIGKAQSKPMNMPPLGNRQERRHPPFSPS
jgi:hypothetical protein